MEASLQNKTQLQKCLRIISSNIEYWYYCTAPSCQILHALASLRQNVPAKRTSNEKYHMPIIANSGVEDYCHANTKQCGNSQCCNDERENEYLAYGIASCERREVRWYYRSKSKFPSTVSRNYKRQTMPKRIDCAKIIESRIWKEYM